MHLPIPLPSAPHIPGRTPRPAGEAFMEIADRAPNPTDPDAWQANEAWLAGFELYRAGYFWEAHEVWEPVWMNAAPNSAERWLAQGLIQIANACLKLSMGRRRAASRLLEHALDCLASASASRLGRCMGVDVAATRIAARGFAAELASEGSVPDVRVLDRKPTLSVEEEI